MKKRHWFFLTLFFSLAWIGYRYPISFDATFNEHNHLQPATKAILAAIQSPVELELFTENPNTREQITELISLFQQENPHLQWKNEQTLLDPDKKWRLGLSGNDHLLIRYQETVQAIDINVAQWNEQTFSQLLYQVTHAEKRWIVFLNGHGEPNLSELDNRHLGHLAAILKDQGLALASINLTETKKIPDNTALLVIADPKTMLLPAEMTLIREYLDRGQNLLWAVNPYAKLEPTLAAMLGINWLPGTLEDTTAESKGAPHRAIHLITEYPKHPVTQALDRLTVFPFATALDYQKASRLGWLARPFLTTPATSVLTEKNQYQNGPFTLGVTLTKGSQRVAVLGNTHFFSNAGIENYGNSALIQHLIHWLMVDDQVLTPTILPVPDAYFNPNRFTEICFSYLFPYILPLGSFFFGWHLRRKRYRTPHFIVAFDITESVSYT
jgi:hypothetical protein